MVVFFCATGELTRTWGDAAHWRAAVGGARPCTCAGLVFFCVNFLLAVAGGGAFPVSPCRPSLLALPLTGRSSERSREKWAFGGRILYILSAAVRHNTRQAESPVRRLLRKSAPGSTRSCAPESTSVCGDVGEVDPQSRSVAATRGRPAAAGQGAGLIRADLRSAQ